MIGCRPLEGEEIAALLKALGATQSGSRDQALAVLGITTGYRISELLSLKVRDVTHAGALNSHVRIPASRMKGRKRGRSAVMAPMAKPYLLNWLDELREAGFDGGNQPLFRSRKHGQPLSRVQAHRVLARAFDAAGIVGQIRELATHSLRKTFAAAMWEAHHQNIWKVQNALGHASPASTVAYLSFEDQEQQAAVSSAFGNAAECAIPVPENKAYG